MRKEFILSKVEGLTNITQTPYAKGGEIFMEGGKDMPQPQNPQINPERSEENTLRSESPRIRKEQKVEHKIPQEKQVNKESAKIQVRSGEIIDKEALRKEWYASFTPDELKNPDTRSTIETAIKLGYSPKTVTSKDGQKVEAKQVIENTLLSDQERIKKAEKLLGQRLSEEQKKAILKAHYEGLGEKGKTGSQAGVYNYTTEQLLRKARILRDEGDFTESQMRTLIESGLAATGGGQTDQEPGPIDVTGITDQEALNLIKKFNQEYGYLDANKIRQLRLDLSRRMQNITNQNEIEVLTTQIFPRLADLLFARQQSEGRGGMRETERALFDRANEFLENLQNANLDPNDITNPSFTPELKQARASLVKDIDEFIKNSNPVETGGFPTEILRLVRYFKELREGLASELIFKSFEEPSEMGHYEMDLYASSNLNTLLGFMSRDDNERYRYFFSLKTAAQYFHTMNSGILTGNFETFGRVAETISYFHFTNMRDVNGSGLVMRLYEQKYKDYLAKDKRITEDGYAALKIEVEEIFRNLNRKGVIRSEYEEYRRDMEGNETPWLMEEWEINRALGAGRTFFNITLRGGENIATGQMPEDRKRYASFPQEDIVRVLNWNEWFLRRFQLGGGATSRHTSHGIEFLGKVTDRYQEFMRYTGEKLDGNRIKEFGGVDVRKMENGAQYHTSGVYSGWRMENMAFDQVFSNLRDTNDNRISVMNFMDNMIDKNALERINNRINKRFKSNPNIDPKDAVTLQDQQEYRDLFMPLINNLDYGLSMLIKNGNIGGSRKLGYLVREEIWKKIALTNVPLTMDYLTNIKYADGTPDASKAKDLATLRNEVVGGWSEESWTLFKGKVLLHHERMIKQAMGQELPPLSAEDAYTPEEQAFIDAVKIEGQKLAPHLADIIFPYMPFMNDIPFELLDYSGPGQTFYKRRAGSDLGAFNKGQGAFIKLMANPGGLSAEDSVKAMEEIVTNISSPEGIETAKEVNFPTFEALIDILITDPGKRQAILKLILEGTRQPTSVAKRWAGVKAESFIETEISNLIDDTVRQGIISPELASYMRKKKKVTFAFILWVLFRDVVLPSSIIVVAEFVDEARKVK